MDRRFATIIAVIVLIFVGVFISTKKSGSDNSGSSASTPPSQHVEGQNQKHVTLVEYGDYECPVCEVYYQPLKQVYSQFSQDIQFQFRNLPLTSLHPNAFAAARAAEAAGLQGKYWEMHDKLYDNQNDWASANAPLNTFTEYANELGLNLNQFKQDYSSQKVNDTINADVAAFTKTGQEMATPTFFLDGKYVANGTFVDAKTGQPSVDKFAEVLRAEIAKKNPGSKNQ